MDAYVLTVGTVIGHRFTVERLVGAGGMGVVYRAIDGFSGLPVALKLVLRGGSETPDAGRFQREILAIAELQSPSSAIYKAVCADIPRGRRRPSSPGQTGQTPTRPPTAGEMLRAGAAAATSSN